MSLYRPGILRICRLPILSANIFMVRKNRYDIVRDNFLRDPEPYVEDIEVQYGNKVLKLPTDYYCYIYLENLPSVEPIGVKELLECASYVGKGRGNRCMEHIASARNSSNKSNEEMKEFMKYLKDVLKNGTVTVIKIAENLTNQQALLYEAAIISAFGKSKLKNKKIGDWAAIKEGNKYLRNMSDSDKILLGLTILHRNIHQAMLTKRQYIGKDELGCSTKEVVIYSLLVLESDPAAHIIVQNEDDAAMINELIKKANGRKTANRNGVQRKYSKTHFTILQVERPNYRVLFQKDARNKQPIPLLFAITKENEKAVKVIPKIEPPLLLENSGNRSFCNSFVQCVRASTITSELATYSQSLVRELHRLCSHTGVEPLEACWKRLLPLDWYKDDSIEHSVIEFGEHIVHSFPDEIENEFITRSTTSSNCSCQDRVIESVEQVILRLTDKMQDTAIEFSWLMKKIYGKSKQIELRCGTCGEKLERRTEIEVPLSCMTLLIALPMTQKISVFRDIELFGVDWVVAAAIHTETPLPSVYVPKKPKSIKPHYTTYVRTIEGRYIHIDDDVVKSQNASFPDSMWGICLIWLDRKIIED